MRLARDSSQKSFSFPTKMRTALPKQLSLYTGHRVIRSILHQQFVQRLYAKGQDSASHGDHRIGVDVVASTASDMGRMGTKKSSC